MAGTLHLSIVTPEKAILEEDARFVAFPAHDGEIGIMANRSPLLCRVGIGRLRAKLEDGSERQLFIDGGFAQMVENRLTILTEQAYDFGEIDRASARLALTEALALPIPDERAFIERQNAIQRARVQLRLTSE